MFRIGTIYIVLNNIRVQQSPRVIQTIKFNTSHIELFCALFHLLYHPDLFPGCLCLLMNTVAELLKTQTQLLYGSLPVFSYYHDLFIIVCCFITETQGQFIKDWDKCFIKVSLASGSRKECGCSHHWIGFGIHLINTWQYSVSINR